MEYLYLEQEYHFRKFLKYVKVIFDMEITIFIKENF